MPLFTKNYSKPGSPPGEALLQESGGGEASVLTLMDFSEKQLVEESNVSIGSLPSYLETEDVTWLHVQGVPTPALLNSLGEAYGLHLLALEDVFKAGQRTKIEPYDDHYFIVLNMPVDTDTGVHCEQVCFFLGQRFLLSIHDGDASLWEPVRQRLRNDPPRRVRSSGPDYLLYTLLDTAVDRSFPFLELLAEKIESIENKIFESPEPESLDSIHSIRHRLIFLRRLLWPQRDMLNVLIRDDSKLLHDRTRVFMRDCYDHTVQIMELVESYHEVTASLHDLYLSSLSNRMNEVMKVLTIIATIFIPLSFVAGIYGMNFDAKTSPWNMPELSAYYGYPVLILLMLVAGLSMLWYFKRKGWF
ncbi:magnesium/cobalt transporter CorA [Pseudomonadota bacterium]